MKNHLTGKLLPFWMRLQDGEYGGYYGYVDYDLKVDKEAVKGCILNSRILWTFSNAYLLFREKQRSCTASNTLLHVFEAYTEFYRVTKKEAVAEKLKEMLGVFEKKIFNPALGRQEVFFDSGWHSLIDLYSYGHDIETAWLIDRGLEILGDEELTKKLSDITEKLAENIYERAYRDHSVANECERGVVNEKRIWWVQAEAVVGFYNAYEKTGREKYLEASKDIWQFIKKYLIDARPAGEWFWYTDKSGVPAKDPVVEPWKCPYHNGRMCMEIIRREEGRL